MLMMINIIGMSIILYFLALVNVNLAYAFIAFIVWQLVLTGYQEYIKSKIIKAVENSLKDIKKD